MGNKYRDTMVRRSDDQLRDMITKVNTYEPEALLAAIEELENRGQGSPELGQMKDDLRKRLAGRMNTKASVGPLTLLKPTKEYLYTPIVLYINVIVWLLMVAFGVDLVAPTAEQLINWGGNLRSITLDGQPWRLLSNTFLHIGIFHLLLNMYTLINTGYILEPAFGKQRYLLCYLGTGILASISSIGYHENIVSAGASGAIFGLEGLLLALLITKNINVPQEAQKKLLSSTVIFIGYNLFYGLMKIGIDNAAHIGGLLSGLLFGFLFSQAKEKRSTLVSATIVVLVLGSVLLAPAFISNKYLEFQRTMERFAVLEEKALWMYKEDPPDSSGLVAYQERLQTECVAFWTENLALLNNLQAMPDDLRQRVDLLKNYSVLRIKSCKAMSAQVANNTTENASELIAIGEEIATVIKQLEDPNKN